MALYTVSTSDIVQAADINQSVNWLKNFVFAVWDYGIYPANTAAQNDTAMATLLAALPACTMYDEAPHLIAGAKTGIILFGLGVYRFSAKITIPPGVITIQGSGKSSWEPIDADITPYMDLGGTALVTSNTTDGFVSVDVDSYGYPATEFCMRDIDLRTVSPGSAGTTSTPPILNLNGWKGGDVINVNVLEVATGGGIGQNLYKIIQCEPNWAKHTTTMQNVKGYGGGVGISINAAHMVALGISGGSTSTNIIFDSSGIYIQQNLDNFFANLHCFASPCGLRFANYLSHEYTPLVIYSLHLEANTHYLRNDSWVTTGTLILENPCWNNTGVDPVTDIPSLVTSTVNVISRNEQNEMGSGTSKHITVASSSQTAGASPYTLPPKPYDRIVVITTTGGMTALTLDGQALFNGTFSVGQQVYVGQGHSLIATWATTAPVFKLLPQ